MPMSMPGSAVGYVLAFFGAFGGLPVLGQPGPPMKGPPAGPVEDSAGSITRPGPDRAMLKLAANAAAASVSPAVPSLMVLFQMTPVARGPASVSW